MQLSLQPRLMTEEANNIRSLILVDDLHDKDKERWHRALVLRKYLTVMLLDKKVCQPLLLQEWEGKDNQSLCWDSTAK